jgi:ABC-type uncharacterized transport system substrate-binding protein
MSLRKWSIAGIALGLALALLTVLVPARKVPRVGFVLTTAPLSTMTGPEPEETVIRAFVHGLRALGYTDGRNIVIERRSAEGKLERLGDVLRGLAQEQVDVIVVTGNPMTVLAKQITSTIPIVVAGVGTPVESGIVQSLARPGGNVTGLVVAIRSDFSTKRLELIREMLPRASRVAYLGLKEDWNAMAALRTTAKAMGLTMVLAEVQMPRIEAALQLLARQPLDALFVSSQPSFFVHRKLIADFARKARVPDFHLFHQAVEVGALASYGHDSNDVFRRAAGYVDRILKGAKAGDLPMEQVERYVLALNLKTAKALGLTIPQSVLFRADRLIE